MANKTYNLSQQLLVLPLILATQERPSSAYIGATFTSSNMPTVNQHTYQIYLIMDAKVNKNLYAYNYTIYMQKVLRDRQCYSWYKKLICNVVLIRRGTTVLTSCGCPSDTTTAACSSGWTIIERGKIA